MRFGAGGGGLEGWEFVGLGREAGEMDVLVTDPAPPAPLEGRVLCCCGAGLPAPTGLEGLTATFFSAALPPPLGAMLSMMPLP